MTGEPKFSCSYPCRSCWESEIIPAKASAEEVIPVKPKLGSGARFKAVEASARKSGAENPAAVAAAAGRKKYGAKKMAQLSAHGRKQH